MKWNHLPVDGGLYAQDPEMLRKFDIIFSALDKHERKERDAQMAEHEKQKRSARTGRPSAGSRRRR
jgi:DNA replicative helicase MCM subunit Mcm2 (Cdc46/Mcm family)